MSCVADFKPNQEVPSYFHNLQASIVPVGILCQAGHYKSSQSSQLATTVYSSSLLGNTQGISNPM